MECLKIQYSLNGNLYKDRIYTDRMFAAGGPAVYNYKRYTLSELENSNWIIDEIYRLVENWKEFKYYGIGEEIGLTLPNGVSNY